MKLLVVADVDDFHWHGSPGNADLAVSCGDVDDSYLIEIAKAHNCQNIFAVKGNHDSTAPFAAPIIDLHLKTAEYNGILFGGLNGCFKYKPAGYFLYEQWEVEEFLKYFPKVDIFVSHNSPKRIHDKNDEGHTGFEALNTYIKRTNPKLLLHGHQHIEKETIVQNTRVVCIYGHRIIEI